MLGDLGYVTISRWIGTGYKCKPKSRPGSGHLHAQLRHNGPNIPAPATLPRSDCRELHDGGRKAWRSASVSSTKCSICHIEASSGLPYPPQPSWSQKVT